MNYLRTIVNRDGHPIKHVCRSQDAPEPTLNPDFLDNYVAMAPLVGEVFTIDSAEVLTLIVMLTAGNEIAEEKI